MPTRMIPTDTHTGPGQWSTVMTPVHRSSSSSHYSRRPGHTSAPARDLSATGSDDSGLAGFAGLLVVLVVLAFIVGMIRFNPQTVTVTLNGRRAAGQPAVPTLRAGTGDTIRVLNHGHHSCQLHGQPQGASINLPSGGVTTFTVPLKGNYTLRCGAGPTAITRLHVTPVLTLSSSST